MQQKKMRKIKKQNISKIGRWTNEQHDKFLKGLMQYGKNWKKVRQIVQTRTAAQVRSHAQKFFYRLDRENRNTQQFSSETQSKQPQQNLSLLTSQNIISLIKKESKEGKSVNVNNFINTLKNQSITISQNIQKEKSSVKSQNTIQILEKQREKIKSMTNLVTAFGNVTQQNEKDQSFFITLLKKYKKFISSNQFIKLIDVPSYTQYLGQQNQKVDLYKKPKQSFNLIQNSDENIENYNKLRKSIKMDIKDKMILRTNQLMDQQLITK